MSKNSYSLMVNMQSKKKTLIIATATIVAVALLILLDIYKCPLDFILGIPCPMCGMTRAVISAASGDFTAAFHYHPLWIVIALGVIFIVLYELRVIRIPKIAFNTICIILGVLLVLCYIVRLLLHSDIVMPHFETSLIHRILSHFM